jgi:TRAP-type C4-dicarboxylate transport system substrate-binding protein
MSERTWQKLSPEDRAAVMKAGAESAAFSRNDIKSNDDRQLAEMTAKGAKVARPNLAPFRDAVKPVYAKAKEKYGADVDHFIADAEAVRKALPAK